MSEPKELLTAIGINKKTIPGIIKNPNLTQILVTLIKEAGVENGCSKDKGSLLYFLATKFPNDEKNPIENRSYIVKYIKNDKIKNTKQLKAALSFLNSNLKPKEKLTSEHDESFEKACGVGVVISKEEMDKVLNKHFEKFKDQLVKERYCFNAFVILTNAKKELVWADDGELKKLFDEKLLSILGPMTEEDKEMRKKSKSKGKKGKKNKEKNKKGNKNKPKKNNENKKTNENITLSENISFHKPEENLQPTEEMLKMHLESTGNKVVTRFPPEPNGFLHLGHCKSMNLNFNYAKKHGGYCYLRFDDTNPHTEKQIYIDSAIDNVKWLSHKPYKISYASDYFELLHEYAVKLIKDGKAYVCHQTSEEVAKGREERKPSPYRNRPIEESLKLFEDMRKGKFEEGKATLRLKMDMSSDNPNMRDLIAYRIKYAPHPHVGSKWCIYPSYDYTHCICDSIENITHSLCSLEFQARNESYRWLLDAIDIYRSPQIEFSRVNVTYTVLSKRKLIKLVNENHVNGWDDPRMPTINGMRRRGYTPEALNAFCEGIGITKHHNVVRFELLEHEVRSHLNKIAKRAFGVIDPLEVSIANYPDDKIEYVDALDFPNRKDSPTHKIPFSNTVFIERSDFKEKNSKKFYGLAPGKRVRLRYAYVIECTDFVKDDNGNITKVVAKYIPNEQIEKNPKGVLHWVAKTKDKSSPILAEVRLYDNLFKAESPGSRTGNYLDDLNPNSMEIKSNCMLDVSFKNAKPLHKFQLERIGYFCVDLASDPNKLILNKTVSLKESKDKKFISNN